MPEPTTEQPEVLTTNEARAGTNRPRMMIIVLIVSVILAVVAMLATGVMGGDRLTDGVAVGGEPSADEQINERGGNKDPGVVQPNEAG